MASDDILDMACRLGTALVLGGVLGLERERKNRPAGFRTMILISLGSAGYMIAAQEIIRMSVPALTPATSAAELSRVLQGLIGGVGFLGAGAVLQSKKTVRGLTTAAAVWVTACVGAAAGFGLYQLAILVSTLTLFTLVVLGWFEDKYFPEPTGDNATKRTNGAAPTSGVEDQE